MTLSIQMKRTKDQDVSFDVFCSPTIFCSAQTEENKTAQNNWEQSVRSAHYDKQPSFTMQVV